ncbi:MAG: hypothetical protein HZC36_04330 [Armatimonadetes bacterium]|nr:hypothetical protein [Armatimonadota bacterium]
MKSFRNTNRSLSPRLRAITVLAALWATCAATPPETLAVHDLELIIGVSNPTNSPVSITLGPTQTFINTPNDDFEVGYYTKAHLRLGTISKISDISGMTIRVHGSDAVTINYLKLYVNGCSDLYYHPTTFAPIVVAGNGSVSFSAAQLRANAAWIAYTGTTWRRTPWPLVQLKQVAYTMAGHAMASPSPLSWKTSTGASALSHVIDEHGVCVKQTLALVQKVTDSTTKTYEVRFTMHYGISCSSGSFWRYVLRNPYSRTVLLNGATVSSSNVPYAVETASKNFFAYFKELLEEPRRNGAKTAEIISDASDANPIRFTF